MLPADWSHRAGRLSPRDELGCNRSADTMTSVGAGDGKIAKLSCKMGQHKGRDP
jgi:hypothetical protein